MSARAASSALALLLALAGPALAQEAPSSDAPRSSATTYEWVFFYYMAYDNNLEGAGKPILKMLQQGLTNEKVCVLVSADFRNTDGMTRYVLTSSGKKETHIKEEGSADEATLKKELEWARGFRAKRYALVFLDHGAGLGQMSYDEHPAAGQRHWLYPPRVNDTIVEWKKGLSGSVELLFLQQCGKGSLENYYAFRKAAKFVMGSQTVIGAPNSYYPKTLESVCAQPDIDGGALAKLITKTESPRMFTTYSTFSSKALEELPKRMNAVLEPLLAVDADAFKAFKLGTLKTCFTFPVRRPRQLFFDGVTLLDKLYTRNGLDRAPFEAFASWVKTSLVISHRVSPLRTRRAGTWSGVSLYVPFSPRGLKAYEGTYAIYTDTKLPALYGRVRKDAIRQIIARRKEAAARRKAKAKTEPAGKKKGDF